MSGDEAIVSIVVKPPTASTYHKRRRYLRSRILTSPRANLWAAHMAAWMDLPQADECQRELDRLWEEWAERTKGRMICDGPGTFDESRSPTPEGVRAMKSWLESLDD